MSEKETTSAKPRRRTHKSRVTAKDVAVRAGVGTMTVSRRFRTPDGVSDELKTRIDEAVNALGYVPNRLAGGLASSRSMTVPVIIPSLSNAVFPDIVEAISGVLQAHDLQMLLGHTQYDINEEEALTETFLSWSPDAMIITGVDHTDRTRAMLKAAQIPIVEILDVTDNPIDMVAGFSHFEAGQAMGAYLVEKNYERLVCVMSSAQRDRRSWRRVEGVKAALKTAGKKPLAVLAMDEPSTLRLGAAAMERILAEHPEADSVFFVNDDLAAGALFECSRRGISVPDTIAIAGFNGLDFGHQSMPRLTTVSTPRFKIGVKAAEMVVARLDDEVVDTSNANLGFAVLKRESA